MEYAWADRGSPTTLSAPAAAAELVEAHRAVEGRTPTLSLAELELAHVWLETNRSQGMWFHNWGNLSAGGFVQTPSGPVERLSWQDVWRPPWYESPPAASQAALHDKMLAGQAPSAFRALPNHREGAAGYVRLLARPAFRGMAEAGNRGDPRGYAAAVYGSGYCRDSGCRPEVLGPKLAALVAEFRRDRVFDGLGLVRPRPPASRSSSGLGAAVLVALLLSERSRS